MADKDIGTVQLTLRHGVDIGEVHKAVETLVSRLRPRGCTACGLVGIDIHILGGDPEFFEQVAPLRESPAVLGVSRAG